MDVLVVRLRATWEGRVSPEKTSDKILAKVLG